ncbi:hypothetical protein ACVITL_005013 [Rhizobium pisi]
MLPAGKIEKNAPRLPVRCRIRRFSRRHVCQFVPSFARPRFRRTRSAGLQACNSAPCCGWRRCADNGGGTTFGSCRESFLLGPTLSNESLESFAADGFRFVMCWRVLGLAKNALRNRSQSRGLARALKLGAWRNTVGSVSRAAGACRLTSRIRSRSEQPTRQLHGLQRGCDHRVGSAWCRRMMMEQRVGASPLRWSGAARALREMAEGIPRAPGLFASAGPSGHNGSSRPSVARDHSRSPCRLFKGPAATSVNPQGVPLRWRSGDACGSAPSSGAIGNGPEQPKETIPWPPRSQP